MHDINRAHDNYIRQIYTNCISKGFMFKERLHASKVDVK